MFASKDIFLKSSGGYQISRSVRLRSSASAYFNRTPAGTGSQTTWTWSGWVKRGLLGGTYNLMQAETSINTYTVLQFSSDNIIFDVRNGGAIVGNKYTSAVYRDPSAWYHIVLVWDTTNATASDRMRVYVNGVRVTAFGTSNDPALNSVSYGLNGAVSQRLGSGVSFANYFDGYLTEVNFIDGQALTPSSFGETNALTGVWQPKRYAGTYGTNGFYLNFSDNSGVTATTIGKDYSGNGNNWTPSAGISITAGTTYDSMIDVPTPYADGGNGRGNYAVINPLDKSNGGNTPTMSNGNLSAAASANPTHFWSTIALPVGSTDGWYWEGICTSMDAVRTYIGMIDPTTTGASPGASYAFIDKAVLSNTGVYYNTASGTAGGSAGTFTSYAANDVVMVAYKNGKIWFGKNGTWMNSGDPAAGTGAVDASVATTKQWIPYFGYNSSWTANFGQRPFTYTPPTGFLALNTQNLPDATIKKGNLFFNTATWSSDIVNPTIGQKSIALGFQPDLVWSKNRDNAESHYWMDSVRGDNAGNKWLRSNATAAEGADALGSTTASYVFNSTGFDIVDTNSASGEVYFNNGSASTPRTYVGWAWNAGGSTVTNTSGTISSQVRANATAGFSVVTWTGAGSAGTIGHGLGVTPSMIIIKNRSGTQFWFVNHTSISATQNLYLNDTASVQSDGIFTSRGSTTFGVGAGVAASSTNYVAYCFAAVAGYSAFGSYTGNGSADGPFVYLGFRPRYLLIKSAVVAGGTWVVFDSARSTYNVTGEKLAPNTADLENSGATGIAGGVDFLSNGFKIRLSWGDINTSNTLIYAAFAENPFKNSLAR